MQRTALLLVLFTACGGDKIVNAPPIDHTTSAGTETGGTSGSTTSSSDTGIDLCVVYFGCIDACGNNDEECKADCATVSGADVDACVEAHCDELFTACADTDANACGELPSCVPSGSSSSSETSGTDSSTGGADTSGTSDTGDTTDTSGSSTSGTDTSGTGSTSSTTSSTTSTSTSTT